jgi:hypothetical protein
MAPSLHTRCTSWTRRDVQLDERDQMSALDVAHSDQLAGGRRLAIDVDQPLD